jgi:hypothetical protein
MSTLSTAPVSPVAAPGRGAHALDEPRDQRRVGIVGTVLVHLALAGLFFLLPEDLIEGDAAAVSVGENRAFEIELSPELLAPVAPPLTPPRFVEVNPDAPENAPDKTALVGAQNQQVAQPVPTPEGISDTPKVDGDGQNNPTAIVSGLGQAEPQPSVAEALAQAFSPPAQPSLVPDREAEEARQAAEAARAVNALPGGETVLGESDGGIGTTVAKVPPVPGAASGPEAVKGTADGRSSASGYFANTRPIDRSRPQERPRLAASAINARATSTIKNEFGSKNIGAVAYDAKWSAYGEYLQRLIDAVQGQWERLILRSAFYPTSGSVVKVVFKLDTAGLVSEVVAVTGTGGELAQRLCVSAITERAPFGEWTDDMRAALGREQELSFTFFYQ